MMTLWRGAFDLFSSFVNKVYTPTDAAHIMAVFVSRRGKKRHKVACLNPVEDEKHKFDQL